ncbi:chemotaxis response regulator protein-glutamate methylesterase [Mediterraneibacter sp. NSJ-55]|uniref:Protein-glutamate methylesterase/protein-glutamine glutaminase n=1 Tax=Mediterraneibacter hominis TaxID=2763054 RepID=A0A923RQ89_9FIRM|nr:chemotaxis response regulator protein-glutamate methylesterase [Mediterraneibacter hominis]MBC5689324.1 chemotaxis response regulator protein-glutamate methylesterase [Mediterraneibacter hominis]
MHKNTAIRLLIVDDSLVFCRFLSIQLPKINPRIQVLGYSMNAYDAFKKISDLQPDVISLDVEMPGMNGIDFLKKLIPSHPIPVILVSSLNVNVFDALSYGAVDFVKKPDMSKNYTAETFVQNLAAKLIMAVSASVKVPPRLKKSLDSTVSPSVGSVLPRITSEYSAAPTRCSASPAALKLSSPSSLKLKDTVIAIGASTGGTEATLEVLKRLPADIPGIVVTQHMPEGFTQMYAQRLDRLCQMEVKEAEDGDIIRQGRVLIAPGGSTHMQVVKNGIYYYVKCAPGEKVNGHRPSVDVLFDSVADNVKGTKVGIILTGMGGDGAKGLLAMRQNGAYTIGQDKSSCVVYGMPMEAYKLGAVCKQAPCSRIADLLISHLNTLN